MIQFIPSSKWWNIRFKTPEDTNIMPAKKFGNSVFIVIGDVYWTKFECILRKIPKKKSEWTRQGETIDWGNGFALPRLFSRPQEGSGKECGRGFEPFLFRFRISCQLKTGAPTLNPFLSS